jgi:hypothetical protein
MKNFETSPVVVPASESISKIPGSNFGVIQEGAMSYIVDVEGNKISNGYHEFSVYKANTPAGEALVLLARTGSATHMLMAPTADSRFFTESEAEFHDIAFNADLGLLLTKSGSLTHIVDPQQGRIVSEGYHEIFERDGALIGKIGSREEVIETSARLPKAEEVMKISN